MQLSLKQIKICILTDAADCEVYIRNLYEATTQMLAICEVESLCDEINVLDNSMRPRH
jgi:hypothetical protein